MLAKKIANIWQLGLSVADDWVDKIALFQLWTKNVSYFGSDPIIYDSDKSCLCVIWC